MSNPEDLPYVGKPAREIVLYSFQKLDRHQKNQEFKESIQKARTEYQVKVEITADTVIQTPENIKTIRNKLIEQSESLSEELNTGSDNSAARFIPVKKDIEIENLAIKEPQLAIKPSFLDPSQKLKPHIEEQQYINPNNQADIYIKPPTAPSFIPTPKTKNDIFLPIKENQVKHDQHFGPRAAYKPDMKLIERIVEEDAQRAAIIEKASKQEKKEESQFFKLKL